MAPSITLLINLTFLSSSIIPKRGLADCWKRGSFEFKSQPAAIGWNWIIIILVLLKIKGNFWVASCMYVYKYNSNTNKQDHYATWKASSNFLCDQNKEMITKWGKENYEERKYTQHEASKLIFYSSWATVPTICVQSKVQQITTTVPPVYELSVQPVFGYRVGIYTLNKSQNWKMNESKWHSWFIPQTKLVSSFNYLKDTLD